MRRLIIVVLGLLVIGNISAQKIISLTSRTGISIRGLSVLDDKNAWVSGTNGTIGQTSDGGKTWHWLQVPQYENRDFRDIELIDSNTAIIMAIETPAILLRTTDKGVHWEKVLEDSRQGMFLDAMAFDGKNGSVVGDPIDGRLYVATSNDKGKSWKAVAGIVSNEGCFASSGTNIVWRNGKFDIVTGGLHSIFVLDGEGLKLPVTQGKETTGANAIAINPNTKAPIAAVVVGGDFNNKDRSDSNCLLISSDVFEKKDQNFIFPIQGPKGYKSCVTYIDDNTLIATGTSGTDISDDRGYNWRHISDVPFHIVQKAKKGVLILFAGPNGNIARWER